MAYFAEAECVFINSAIFPDDHEGVVISVPEDGERYYDVLVTKSDDKAFRYVPFLEAELTKKDS